MPEHEFDDTQPVAATQPSAASNLKHKPEQTALAQAAPEQTAPGGSRRAKLRAWITITALVLVFLLLLGGSIAAGAYQGYQAAQQDYQLQAIVQASQSIVEQYTLAVEELNAGEYDLARQRFEYVLARDPAFPGAAEGLVQAMQVLFATATPTALPPTPTLTPTADLRPLEDRFQQAARLFETGNWDVVIDTLIALRQADPAYRTVEVDSLLFRTLRTRGLEKIRDLGSLEGGIYDLSLAEKFGPLDTNAQNYRYLARLYMIGLGFWEVFPQQAIYYFGQLAAAAPYLQDGSGWTAFERYYVSILQYAGQLAGSGDWCAAQEQYELAQAVRPNLSMQPTLAFAVIQCSPPTATLAPTISSTLTQTLTLTPSATPEITLTPTFPATPTATPPLGSTATSTPSPTTAITAPAPSETPTPTDTQVVEPPTPTLPASSDTPAPTATETPTPGSEGRLPLPLSWLAMLLSAWVGYLTGALR
jgi:tetratricopeptide (TPR) repeat protein